jgi:hypothetical protein
MVYTPYYGLLHVLVPRDSFNHADILILLYIGIGMIRSLFRIQPLSSQDWDDPSSPARARFLNGPRQTTIFYTGIVVPDNGLPRVVCSKKKVVLLINHEAGAFG